MPRSPIWPPSCGTLVALLLVLAWPWGRAAAQAPSIDVPAGCGSEQALRTKLASLVGGDAVARAMPARLRIVPTEERYELELELARPHGGSARVLRDADCAALFRSAAVIAAAAVAPRAQAPAEQAPAPEQPPPREPPAVAPAPTTPASSATAPEPSAPQSQPRRKDEIARLRDAAPPEASPVTEVGEAPSRVFIAAGAGLAGGLLPGMAAQLELVALVQVGRLGGVAALRYTPSRLARLDAEQGADIMALGGRVGFSYAPFTLLRLSLGPELSRVMADTRGVLLADDSGGAWLFGMYAEAAPRISWDALTVELAFSARHAFSRPSFEVVELGELHRTARWGAEVSLRLGFLAP